MYPTGILTNCKNYVILMASDFVCRLSNKGDGKMTKKMTVKANFVLCGVCFALCFFAFMLTEASVNERCAEVVGERFVNVVYAVGLVCTGLGYLSFPAMRRLCKSDTVQKTVLCIVGVFCTAASILLIAVQIPALFLVSSAVSLYLFGYIGGCVYYNTAMFLFENRFMGRIIGSGMGAAILLQYLVQNLAFDAVVMIVIDILSITFVICFILKTPKYQIPERSRLQGSSEPGKKDRSGLILTAAVILMSLVSGMTDSILTAFHAEQTCNIYSSVRLFYALGLIAAGWIADIRKRQYLPLATVCAILLSSVSAVFLSDQASYLAGTALMYVYSGFYIIFLTVMFFDYAPRSCHPELWTGMGRILRSFTVAVAIIPTNMLYYTMGGTALAVGSCVFSIGVLLVLLPYISNAVVSSGKKEEVREKQTLSAGQSLKLYAEHYAMTPRETEVLEKLLTTEESVQEIADSLYISRRMLQRYIASIYEKTEAKTRIGLYQSYTQFVTKL